MLDAYIIDALRREHEESEDERPQPSLELPVPPAPPPTNEEPAKSRIIIIEL